jgi:hypothetical protein
MNTNMYIYMRGNVSEEHSVFIFGREISTLLRTAGTHLPNYTVLQMIRTLTAAMRGNSPEMHSIRSLHAEGRECATQDCTCQPAGSAKWPL